MFSDLLIARMIATTPRSMSKMEPTTSDVIFNNEWKLPHEVSNPCIHQGKNLFVQALGLLVQSLSLGGLSTDSAESLDSQSLSGLVDSSGPSLDVLECLLSSSAGLLGDDLSSLVLHQVGLLQSTDSLHLGSSEDAGFTSLSLSDDPMLHCFLLHALHRLHGFPH